MRRVAGLFALVVLSACAGGRAPAPEPALPAASPTPEALAATPTPVPPVPAPVPPPTAYLLGTVSYRQRIALTPEAEVHVELREASPADAGSLPIAKQVIRRPGQVPVAFSLEYDPTRILGGRSYVLSARIADRGQLQFVTETPVPVLTGEPQAAIEILVVPVR